MVSFNAAFLATLELAAMVAAAPTQRDGIHGSGKRASPKVYLAGDSTMALGGGGSSTQGPPKAIHPRNAGVSNSLNDAIAGRSARSYTDEGRFSAIADVVTSSDYVIIEFGHNDGGSLTPTDNGRSDCVGSGDETCTTSAGLVVQTYPTYITNAANNFTAKGAHVIIASPTPNNVCESGTCSYTASRFTGYASLSATNTNGTGLASFVDHGLYMANEFIKEGATTIDGYYPNDHTHTSPEGAAAIAQQFIKGVLCAGSPLAAFVINSTSSISGSCV